jgi:hypothetical protein
MIAAINLDLFEAAPRPPRRNGRALKRERLARFRAEVEPVALTVAIEAGEIGFTAADVRIHALREGLVPPNANDQRAWSFLAGLLQSLVARGELVPTGYRRKSPIRESKGTKHQVYIHRRYLGEPR